MPKIKSDKEIKKVEGYLDNERNVFVITSDPHGLLSKPPEPTPINEVEINYEKVGELLKKYKPIFP
jgi:hypothetical protein